MCTKYDKELQRLSCFPAIVVILNCYCWQHEIYYDPYSLTVFSSTGPKAGWVRRVELWWRRRVGFLRCSFVTLNVFLTWIRALLLLLNMSSIPIQLIFISTDGCWPYLTLKIDASFHRSDPTWRNDASTPASPSASASLWRVMDFQRLHIQVLLSPFEAKMTWMIESQCCPDENDLKSLKIRLDFESWIFIIC